MVKEIVDAEIVDTIDVKYYRDNSQIRIDKDKFVKNFLISFIDSVENNRYYRIGFYVLNEVPPKVSIKVDSSTVLNFNSDNINFLLYMMA